VGQSCTVSPDARNVDQTGGTVSRGSRLTELLMAFLLILLMMIVLVFVLIAVHETGHYLAGLTAGIPASTMRIRLFTFPQHVALRDGDDWLSPIADIERYVNVSRRYLSSRGAAFRWVAGGMVVETIFTSLSCVTAFLLGWTFLAFWTAVMSLSMYVINVSLMDVPWALIRGHAFGDTSGLWIIAKLPAALLTILLLIVRISLVWYAA
jgi:hypothetical protein